MFGYNLLLAIMLHRENISQLKKNLVKLKISQANEIFSTSENFWQNLLYSK